jgi:hypothetical protein
MSMGLHKKPELMGNHESENHNIQGQHNMKDKDKDPEDGTI